MGSSIEKLFGGQKENRILLAGLTASGKTTILYMLKSGDVSNTVQTIGYNVETIKWKNVNFTAWDVGGIIIGKMYPLMHDYFINTKALVYVVDSNEPDQLEEAKNQLSTIAKEDELKDSLIMVFANKQDLPNAKSPMAISEALELYKLKQHCHIIPTVATTGDGLTEGLQWIVEMMNKQCLSQDIKEVADEGPTELCQKR